MVDEHLTCLSCVGTAGGVYAAGRSNVTISRSVLASNVVKDYDLPASGGACCVNDSATLSLVNTTVRNNEAQMIGGGVSMESKRCGWLAGWGCWVCAGGMHPTLGVIVDGSAVLCPYK